MVTGLGKLGRKCQLIVTACGSQMCVGGTLGSQCALWGTPENSSLVVLSKWGAIAGAENMHPPAQDKALGRGPSLGHLQA